MNDKGFTLIELIVVLIILTILMCLTAPSVFGYSRKAQETAAIEECKGVVTAVIDIFSEEYVNTGRRITGTECLKGKFYGREASDVIDEAKHMAGVDGNVNGEWIRGNNSYILSHLVYEWSDNLWVVYDEGEYKIYKGKGGIPDDEKNKALPEDGTEPLNKKTNPPTNNYEDEDNNDEETTNSAMPKPTEATTEEVTEATTQATTKTEPTTELTTQKPEPPVGDGVILKDGSTGEHSHPFFESQPSYWDKARDMIIEKAATDQNYKYQGFCFNWGDILMGSDPNTIYIIANPTTFLIFYNVDDTYNYNLSFPSGANTTFDEYYNAWLSRSENNMWGIVPVTSNNVVYEINNGVWADNIDPSTPLNRGDMIKIDGVYYVYNAAGNEPISGIYSQFLENNRGNSWNSSRANTFIEGDPNFIKVNAAKG